MTVSFWNTLIVDLWILGESMNKGTLIGFGFIFEVLMISAVM